MFDRKVFSLLNSPAHLLSLGSTSQCPWLSQTTVSIWRGNEDGQYKDCQCEQTRTPLQKKSQDVPVTIEAPGGWGGSQLQNPPVSWSGKTFLIILSFFLISTFFYLLLTCGSAGHVTKIGGIKSWAWELLVSTKMKSKKNLLYRKFSFVNSPAHCWK